MFFQYETPRLLLKVLRADCAPQVLDFYNRDKELFEMYEIDDKKDFSNAIVEMYEIDRVPDFYTVKHLQKVLRYEYNMAVKSQLFRFYVFKKENPCRIIGTVCIHNIAPAFYGSCEIGYKFSSEFHHMGYATEAVGFCTKLAFNELHMHKVTAVVHPGNVPSMKLLNGLGFVQEGLLRDYLMLHGQWCNHYIYGLVNK